MSGAETFSHRPTVLLGYVFFLCDKMPKERQDLRKKDDEVIRVVKRKQTAKQKSFPVSVIIKSFRPQYQEGNIPTLSKKEVE